ncbi:MAG TPA: cytochrome c oxidase subunit II [Pyrinomonadaceae bacterium]
MSYHTAARQGHGAVRRVSGAGALVLLAGCGGVQSTLDPAGREAARIADLFWWMAAGSVVVWLAVIALALWAVRARPESHNLRRTRLLIVGGGAVVPTVVLTALLVYGLAPIPALLAPAPEGSLKVAVTGEQWWWRVRYHTNGGEEVTLANEIRLPVGHPVEFRLDSPDVIHSFWIPPLAGKVDMIPGRVTRLVLRPTRTGVFRGVCAEYCGASHALMAFNVVVQEREEFDRWLAGQAFFAHMTMHMGVVALAAPLVALGVAGARFDPVRRAPALFAPVSASIFGSAQKVMLVREGASPPGCNGR